MSAIRLRRLQADHVRLQDFVRRHPRVQLLRAEGDPPERYQLRYQVRGLRQKDDQLIEVDDHLVEIALPRNYPRTPPQCRMLTPVFHPNIAPHAVCIGDHWSAGESLASIVARIGELLAFQSYNTKSPLNGEAARWVDTHLDRLPLDPVSLVPDELPVVAAPPPPPAVMPVPDEEVILGVLPLDEPEAIIPTLTPLPEEFPLSCPKCLSRLIVPTELLGRSTRCPGCQNVIPVPEQIDA